MNQTQATKKTSRERQIDFKARKQNSGLKEIRNLWAKPENHEAVKKYTKQLEQKEVAK